MWSVGDGDCGRLGHGGEATDNVTSPRRIALTLPVRCVAAGDAFGLALLFDGNIWSWGDNQLGQLGWGGRKSSLSDEPNCTPRPVKGGKAVECIAAGATHCAAVTKDGHVLTWGANAHGQLGFPPSADDSDFEDDLDGEESEGGTATEEDSTSSESDEFDEYADFGASIRTGAGQFDNAPKTRKSKKNAATGPLCSTRPKVLDALAQHGDDVTVVAAACGREHTAVLTRAHVVYTFGCGRFGRLGHGSTKNARGRELSSPGFPKSCFKPKAVTRMKEHKVFHVACGVQSTLAITQVGELSNSSAQA